MKLSRHITIVKEMLDGALRQHHSIRWRVIGQWTQGPDELRGKCDCRCSAGVVLVPPVKFE